jgi:hypothetical protein
VAFLIIRSWSDSESAESSEPVVSSTISPPTRPPPTSVPEPTPEPTPVVLGDQERVWVYADSTIVPDSCLDLVPVMIPADEPASAMGKAVRCTPAVADIFRTTYRRGPDGVLRLQSIELFVVTTPALPQPFGNEECRDIEPYLLPADQPVENAGFVAVCSWAPSARGAPPRSRIAAWSAVVEGSGAPPFPPDTPCWRMLPYLGAPRGADTVKVRCIIE